MRASWTLVMEPVMALALGGAAPPADISRPVVVELFTSQGCSSCPPADAFLADLARDRGDVLALAFHVTYWNALGWADPFASAAMTDRQRRYATLLGHHMVYTPQMVVDGRRDVIGSDRPAALAAIRAAAAESAGGPQVKLSRQGDAVAVTVGAGQGGGQIILLGFDPRHSTAVERGENGGRTLTEANIVRAIVAAGDWNGQPLARVVPRPAGERLAAIVQADDGRILGAARLASADDRD